MQSVPKEIADEFKSRINNPLIGSFVIAWLIINWQIPILLFFYKLEELNHNGYDNFIDAVQKNTDTTHNLWLPLLCAFVYVIFSPIMRWGIVWWLTKFTVLIDNSLISEKSKLVTIQHRLLEKENTIQEKINEILTKDQEIINLTNEKAHVSTELSNFKTAAEDTENKFRQLIESQQENQTRNWIGLLNGKWEISFTAHTDGDKKEIWNFRDGEIYVGDLIYYRLRSQIALGTQLWLNIVVVNNNSYLLFILEFDTRATILEGNDGLGNQVIMKKIP